MEDSNKVAAKQMFGLATSELARAVAVLVDEYLQSPAIRAACPPPQATSKRRIQQMMT